MLRSNLITAALAGCLLPAVPSGAQEIVNLGVLPGTTTSEGVAISSGGEYAAAVCNTGTAVTRSFRWRSNGTINDITDGLGLLTHTAVGMSNDGQSIAMGTRYPAISWFPAIASRWRSGTGVQLMQGNHIAKGISGDGNWVVGHLPYGISPSLSSGAFRAADNDYTLCDRTWASYLSDYIVTAANENGAVLVGSARVYYSELGLAYKEPWVWFPNSPLPLFYATEQHPSWGASGLLPRIGAVAESEALAVDDNGDVIVGFSGTSPARWIKTCIGQSYWNCWQVQSLFMLADHDSGKALGVSPDGRLAVGLCVGGAYNTTACLWTPELGVRDLNNFLPSLGVNLSGWYLTECRDIDNTGNMVGTGYYQGNKRAFVARGLPCVRPPTVTQQPTPAGACSLGTATFTVAGSSTSPMTYQWVRNNFIIANGATATGAVVTGATSPTLTISNVQGPDAGTFRCIISNACGSVNTASANLTVGPTLTIQPLSSTIPFCTSHTTLNVPVVSNGGSWHWQARVNGVWTYLNNGAFNDGLPYGFSFSVSGATSSLLSLSSINFTSAQSIEFRCIVWDACGNAAQPSTTLSLVRNNPIAFTQHPSNLTICPTAPATFTAAASGGSITYRWYRYCPITIDWYQVFDGSSIDGLTLMNSTVTGADTSSMTFQVTDLGVHPATVYFKCLAQNACGTTESQNATLTLTTPTLATIPQSKSACVGGIVSFGFSLAGSTSGVTYQWFRRTGSFTFTPLTDGIDFGTGLSISGSATPVLVMESLPAFMEGEYHCAVYYPCGSFATPRVFLTLTEQSPQVSQNPTPQTICPRGLATFNAAVFDPDSFPVQYQWQRETAPNSGVYIDLPNGSTNPWDGAGPGVGALIAGTQSPTLSIGWGGTHTQYLSPVHTRRYRCRISNTCGNSFTSPALLTICMADFNCSGDVTVQDLYDYLGDWNSQAYSGPILIASADTNHDGVITVQDIYDFMAYWNAGCIY